MSCVNRSDNSPPYRTDFLLTQTMQVILLNLKVNQESSINNFIKKEALNWSKVTVKTMYKIFIFQINAVLLNF